MTRDDIIRMAREAGLSTAYAVIAEHPDGTQTVLDHRPFLERFAALVAAHEREMCARVADAEAEESVDCCYSLAVRVSSAIRARGETK